MTPLSHLLCSIRKQNLGAVAVDISTRKPQLSLRFPSKRGTGMSRPTIVPLTADAWNAHTWTGVARWWAVSAPEVRLTLAGEPVKGNLLTHHSNLRMEGDNYRVYSHAGTGQLLWVEEGVGVRAAENIPSFHGEDFAVVFREPLGEEVRVRVREWILTRRPVWWQSPEPLEDSATLIGKMAVSVSRSKGVYWFAVDETATWLRHHLPLLRVGVPSVSDVTTKLTLERRLRVEEGVPGSLRPLAFTLQAMPEEDDTFPWPGLWAVEGPSKDYRADLPALLAWDAVLHVVSASLRLHTEFKPGLTYAGRPVGTVEVRERRFSKRESGKVDSAYVLLNPGALLGDSADVVAFRLLQHATHELAHLSVGESLPHSETYVHRREHMLSGVAPLLPAVGELAGKLGLVGRPSRTQSLPPILIFPWLHDTLQESPVSLDRLVMSWASIRNLTEGQSTREVTEALGILWNNGETQWRPGDLVVSV